MIDFTRPVRTKDGSKVRVLCTDCPGKYPVIGIIEGDNEPRNWTLEGRFHSQEHSWDLENEPQRIKKYANIYRDGDEYWVAGPLQDTYEKAKDYKNGEVYITTVAVEFDI